MWVLLINSSVMALKGMSLVIHQVVKAATISNNSLVVELVGINSSYYVRLSGSLNSLSY